MVVSEEGRPRGFLSRITEFLNSEIPDYVEIPDTIYYCDSCLSPIPKTIHDKFNGSCRRCAKNA